MALRKPSKEVKNFDYPAKFFSTWVPMIDKNKGFFENIAIMFQGEVDDNEVYVYEGYFRYGGGKNCKFPIPEGAEEAYSEFQMLTLVPKDGNPGMHPDNKYYSTDLTPDPRVTKWEVIESEDKVEWILGESKYTMAPPYFYTEGKLGGLEREGVFIPYEDQVTIPVPYDMAGQAQAGNYTIKGTWEGTVTIGGVKKEVKNATGELIYILLGNDYDNYQPASSVTYYYWIQLCSEKYSQYMFFGDHKEGLQNTLDIHVDGQPIHFEQGQYNIVDTEFYEEKAMRTSWPCRWTITAENEHGKLEMDLRARGRAHFQTESNTGSTYYTGYAVHANGTFTYPDGRVFKIDDVMGYVERGTPMIEFTPPESWDW